MTLRRKQELLVIVFAAGVLLLLLAPPVWLKAAGVLAALAALVLHRTRVRCPACGAAIRQLHQNHCSGCGEEIPWDAK